MSNSPITGVIHSIQTLGTLDGPGVRFVLFTQGCNLRCGCCHNPDTWQSHGGTRYTAPELADRAERYRTYFGKEGGVTVSGGEPLLQAPFVTEFFALCHGRGIHTCLDTSGSILTDNVKALLAQTDRVLLDIKYPSEEQYRQYVGCSLDAPLAFLDYLNQQGIPTTLRQVIIPTLNDNADSMAFLSELASKHPCVNKIELLPFKKICQVKYDKLEIPFPFAHLPEPTAEQVSALEALI
ncbi:MAG: pyruvate formate lyase-activating protein [Clostridia bacterium]|nr:pyruvate formate lyase-activating protein [Clostridia bacterium]